MRTLDEQIQRLRNVLVTCYNAIERKGGTIPEVGERNMYNLPAAVRSIPQEHTELTELTVTANGEYLPADYDADGFSKVTAQVVPIMRVMLPNEIKIPNELIIDGYWAGELVDTSQMTSMWQMFRGCSQLQSLDVSGWDVSKVTRTGLMFYGCSQLQNLDVSNWDTSNFVAVDSMFYQCYQLQTLNVSNWDTSSVTNMREMFVGCSQLQNIDVSNWDTSSVTDMWQMFRSCSQLQNIDVSNWNVNKVTRTVLMFDTCSKLQTLIGNRTINDVLMNNINALNGLKVALSLNHTTIDTASILALVNGLADLTGQTAQTLTLGNTIGARLDTEQIAGVPAKDYLASKAGEKNWTIAY